MISKQAGVRPSDYLAIEDEHTRWCFDRAVVRFGLALDADLEKAGAKAKTDREAVRRRQTALGKWLGVEKEYRDPAKEKES